MQNIDIYSVILIAFLGSFGHCLGMCGGIVLAYSSSKIQAKHSKFRQIISHLLYSFGRITSYTILGFIFGLLGLGVTFNNKANAILLIFLAFIMLLMGFSLLGKSTFLLSLEKNILAQSWYKKTFSLLLKSDKILSFYALGILNGFLPCGLVYFFAISAAASGSAYRGALLMFVFGLSTIPALFSLGFFLGLFKNSSLRVIFMKSSAVLVLLYSFYTFYRAFKYFLA